MIIVICLVIIIIPVMPVMADSFNDIMSVFGIMIVTKIRDEIANSFDGCSIF